MLAGAVFLVVVFGQGIHVTAYSPLGSPDSATMMKRSDDAPRLLHEAVVVDIAKQHNKAAAQVRR